MICSCLRLQGPVENLAALLEIGVIAAVVCVVTAQGTFPRNTQTSARNYLIWINHYQRLKVSSTAAAARSASAAQCKYHSFYYKNSGMYSLS